MSDNYKFLIGIIAKLQDDDVQALAESLPHIFDTNHETTSVVIPFDGEDYVSFSSKSECLYASMPTKHLQLNSCETNKFLEVVKAYL